MQDHVETPKSDNKDMGSTLTWRLTQIVLVLAASYLYFLFASIGGLLQRDRLFANPHTGAILQTAALGVGIGICIGFALKNLANRRIAISVDWPTLIINLVAAGVFAAASFSYAIAAVRNTVVISGALKNATWLSPLLPFVWIGLTITTIVKAKPE